jgi:hypothetical protein
MPPDLKNQYDQINQQMQQASPEDANNLKLQSDELVAQFSSPILAQLVAEYSEKISAPSDEDPLITLKRQEIALKGQELAQEQQQFIVDQKRKAEDSARQDKIDRERIAAQEDIAEMRDDTARARLDQQKQLKIQDLLNKYNK